MNELLVFNIQKYSLHDGAGIRTVVFLKGCPLHCLWCSNPESQRAVPELIYRKSKCLGKDKCGLCENSCPLARMRFDDYGEAVPDFSVMNFGNDYSWTSVCPSKALGVSGEYKSIDDILDVVEADSAFYRDGGGLTISGGEPLMQSASVDLLKEAKARFINTAVETCGCVDTDTLLHAALYLDKIFFDIKSVDDVKHKEYTGQGGVLIRYNLEALVNAGYASLITVRTPVIPRFNDCEEDLSAIVKYLKRIGIDRWEKLTYHRYGVGKYEMLGRPYLLKE
ncbi:MAG: glycyl-radical enzyme activating protein [Clostridiales bacterium]|nr:glycyl-radical enzyme activating protein [Clostridiales bacterium]